MVCLFFGDHFIRTKCVYCIRLNIHEIYYAGCGNEMEVEIWSVVVGTLLYLISLNDDSFQAVVLQHKDVPQRTAVLTGEQLNSVFCKCSAFRPVSAECWLPQPLQLFFDLNNNQGMFVIKYPGYLSLQLELKLVNILG